MKVSGEEREEVLPGWLWVVPCTLTLLLLSAYGWNRALRLQEIQRSEDLGQLVSLSARQRSLCQRIAKDMLILSGGSAAKAKERAEVELGETVRELAERHRELRGRLEGGDPLPGDPARLLARAIPDIAELEQLGREALPEGEALAAKALAVLTMEERLLPALNEFDSHLARTRLDMQILEHQRQEDADLLGAGLVFALFGVAVLPFLRRLQRHNRWRQEHAAVLARLSLVAEKTTNGVVITDAQRRVTWANAAFTRITGYKREEMIGKPCERYILARQENPRIEELLEQRLAAEKPLHAEWQGWRNDGRRCWLDTDIQPLPDASGKSTGFLVVQADITARREAQEEVIRREAALASTARLARVGWWEFDLEKEEVIWSEMTRELHEVGPDFQPKAYTALTFYPEEARERISAGFDRAVAEGRPLDMELPFLTARGNRRWVRVQAVAVMEGGRAVRLSGSLQDISLQRAQQDELLEGQARLAAFVQHTPAAVAMFDLQMRYLVWTQQWLEDYHLEGQELEGRSHYEVFPGMPDHWRQIHQRCLAGAVERNAADVWRPPGRDRDQVLRWEVRPWHRKDGSIGGIMVLTEDVTEDTRLEDSRRKT